MRAPSARPTPEELQAAHGRRVPDLIRTDLRVLFCGINPSLYSAAVGHHFARPGNRFWKTLYQARFTPRLLAPSEDRMLLDWDLGLTNVFWRATASAAELTPGDYVAGARALRRKLIRYRPRILAILGVEAYRRVSGEPGARVGEQPALFAGCRVWGLPNPSGLNAHYQLPELTDLYAELAREGMRR
jgi:TDG/mug DNA glycosylase family protein